MVDPLTSDVTGDITDLSFCLRIMVYMYKPSIAYVLESGPREKQDDGKYYRLLLRSYFSVVSFVSGAFLIFKLLRTN